MDLCCVEGCDQSVSKLGYDFCLNHWKADRNGKLIRCKRCDRLLEAGAPHTCAPRPAGSVDSEEEFGSTLLTSSKIGQYFDLSPIKTNLILAELGWIEKYVKGWLPTDRGNALGANIKESNKGVPYVVWPESILKNTALLSSVTEQTGPRVVPAPADAAPPKPATPAAKPDPAKPLDDFRTKFPATLRTQDGHMVRSRAEVLIDNWLYMQGLVHAYERRLPIEEECYCDFYLPGGKGVYIECDRMAVKQAIYAKHGLRLIELGDAEIERLDDVLPRMLLRFGIESA
jgi:hypothetical protein